MKRNGSQTDPDIDSRDIATPAQMAALRAEQKQRLKDQVEVLLRALEAFEPPVDYAGVEKAARAMIAANKAMDEIYADDIQPEEEQMHDDNDAGHGAIDAWKVELERKLDRLAAARGEKTMAGEFGPYQPKCDDGLGVLGKAGTAGTKRKMA